MLRRKSIPLLLMLTLFSICLLSACGSSDTGEVQITFATFDQTKPTSLKSVSGLAAQEPFGIWSQEKNVTFEFDQPLPKKFSLSVRAYAFGPNVGKEFSAAVGTGSSKFTLPANNPATVTVTLENPGKAKTLTIEVPEPTRPRDLNLNSDGRKLGMAFYELSIKPL